jgi:hypothetical protein
MEEHRYRYVSMAASAVGCGIVAIKLEGDRGVQFLAILSADDAQRLSNDLPQQIRIAIQNST